MQVLMELFLTFAKIGLFTIGGGYAMIPLITQEITRRNWLTLEGVIDISHSEMIALASIPLPLSVFSNGTGWSAAATLGVIAPSFIIVVLVARYLPG